MTFWSCFVPLFIAVDSIGLLPIFLGLVEGMDRSQVKKVLFQSILTAALVALLFLFVGEAVLRLLGITVPDFMIAGGIILFLIAINGLFTDSEKRRGVNPDQLGVVPIGVPLIAGPAVLTTSMLLIREHGLTPTAFALIANIIVAGLMFGSSRHILKIMGASGAKIISKVAHLLLAAIAVMMVRKGLAAFWGF